MIDYGDGQQSGVVTVYRGKLTPPAPNNAIVFGITIMESAANRWSSVTITMMFGRGSTAAAAPFARDPDGSPAATTSSSEVHAMSARPHLRPEHAPLSVAGYRCLFLGSLTQANQATSANRSWA